MAHADGEMVSTSCGRVSVLYAHRWVSRQRQCFHILSSFDLRRSFMVLSPAYTRATIQRAATINVSSYYTDVDIVTWDAEFSLPFFTETRWHVVRRVCHCFATR